LSIGGPVFLTAERHETVDGVVRFYRNGSVLAEYATATVKDVMVVTPSPKPGRGEVEDNEAR
jgi:hypothetical protein